MALFGSLAGEGLALAMVSPLAGRSNFRAGSGTVLVGSPMGEGVALGSGVFGATVDEVSEKRRTEGSIRTVRASLAFVGRVAEADAAAKATESAGEGDTSDPC